METVISIGDIHGDFKVILEVLFNELHKRKGINKLMFQLVTNDNVINIATITKSQFEIKQNNPLDYQEDINSVFELIKDLIFNSNLARDRLLSYHYQLVTEPMINIKSFFNDEQLLDDVKVNRKLIILGDIFDTRNEPGDYYRRICECFNINAFNYDSFYDFLLRFIKPNNTSNNLASIINTNPSIKPSFNILFDLLNQLLDLILQNNINGINNFIYHYSIYIKPINQQTQITDSFITPTKGELNIAFYHKLLFYLVLSYLNNNVDVNIVRNIKSIMITQRLHSDNFIKLLNEQYQKLINSLRIPLWNSYYHDMNNIKCELVKDVFEILTFKMIEFIKISVDGINLNTRRFNHNNIFLVIGNHDAKYNLLNSKYSFIGDNINMFVDYYKFNNTIYSHYSRDLITNELNYDNKLVNELEICFKIFKSIVNGNIDYSLLNVFISFYDNLLINYQFQNLNEYQLIVAKVKIIIDYINNLNPNQSSFNPSIDQLNKFIDTNELLLFNNIKQLTDNIFYRNILFLLNRYVNVISCFIQDKKNKISGVELMHFNNLFNYGLRDKLIDSLYQVHGHMNMLITKNIISLDIRMSRFKCNLNCNNYFKELKYCYLKHQIIDNKNVLIYYTTAYDNNTSNMYLATFGNQYIESVKNNVIFKGNNRVNNELFRINDSTRLVINDNVYVQPNSDVIKKNMFNIGGDNVDLNYYLFIRFPDGLINLKSKDKLLALVDKFINK